MNYIRLTYFTISDLLFSGILIIMSIIYSGFPKELSAIFIISFMFRFVWNYFILKEHKIDLEDGK
jgi:hypothetical protein